MLPPAFRALTGIADNATPNPATRNIRASALERIPAVIVLPPMCRPSGIPDRRWLPARLSGNAVAGKADHTPRMKTPQVNVSLCEARCQLRAVACPLPAKDAILCSDRQVSFR